MSKISWWRTIPPAGPPLPLQSIINSLVSMQKENTEENLHDALKQYFKVSDVFLTDSGRSGLSLALVALSNLLSKEERNSRTEVLIPAYVSYSVPSALVHAGFKVNLYDIDPVTLTPDYESMRAHASEKTLAIVICHQFGLPFNGQKAKEIAHQSGAFLVDDAAQVMGGMIGENYAGCMGDVGLFSLSRGKPLTAVEGGIVVTNSTKIANSIQEVIAEEFKKDGLDKQVKRFSDVSNMAKSFALYLLRRPACYTIPTSLPWLKIGASVFEPNFPDGFMSPYRVALTLESLPLLEDANTTRRAWANKYTQLVNEQQELRTIFTEPTAQTVYLRYPVLPEKGSEKYVQKIFLHKKGASAKKLGISRGFPQPLHEVENLKPHLTNSLNDKVEYPGASYLASNLLTLPTHDQVNQKDYKVMKRFFAEISSLK